ncbi:protein NRT1/ PTR FAMILY 8.3 [Zea mays]|uniref:Protein NRT1/ PTR FAMILY 8.3 n=1 Tax=Zea mays TaxID=4577 RepID=A0A804NUW6_MAIZE|nr:protein NRT1/ PTR FAMILY 8.3 [Zea mays]|eukprot:XP_008678997.1 protein NRT1/ PTR FAMILY 8.3 isoform X2 [Zea mays]
MDAAGDAMERGDRAPLLPVSQGPKVRDDDSLQVPLLKDKKRAGSKAPAVVLGFECLESTAFNGISTNLVVYLETVLHGSNLASASDVTTWFGTSFLTPVFGAIIADTFLGNYNTILVSLAVYLLGMMFVTFSAFLPTAAALGGATSVFGAKTVAFLGLYLVAIGRGGVQSSLAPFGADQFDDANPADRDSKASFFSWFYLCVDFGMIVSGLVIVWVQDNVSWGLGFGISTACLALAFAAFVLATPMYKRRMPTGTPLKSLSQVVVAACRKIALKAPADAGMLFEVSDKVDAAQPKIAHTDEFSFLDKAAIVSESDMEEMSSEEACSSSWKLCTVTQVEELKILMRLLPIWVTSVIVSSAYAQMTTTFIQQGSAMDMSILSVPVAAASMGSFEVVFLLTWVLLYSKVIVPVLRGFSSGGDGEPSQLQRMGAGRLLMALSMAASALAEMKRLDSAARGEEITIAWQLPQYFFMAGAEVFCYIAQLEFFYAEAPDTMKSTCTSLSLLTIALGSYMSSFIYAIVAAFTATPDSPGWISDNLNQGHLDYFFWTMAAMCTLNFVVYSGFAKNYKLKTVLS